jgi:hypothetical protein
LKTSADPRQILANAVVEEAARAGRVQVVALRYDLASGVVVGIL